MGDSSIEWTDFTWNPTTGCDKIDQGCKFCYAERIFHRPYPGRKFTDVRMHPDRLGVPFGMKRGRRIFVDSMSDLFHKDVPFAYIDEVFTQMVKADWHTYQVLTKRPERAREYFGQRSFTKSIAHIWIGTSVSDQESCDIRLPELLQINVPVRFVSYEPALGPVNFGLLGTAPKDWGYGYTAIYTLLHWIIAGGESGPKARPADPDWFRAVRDECKQADVAFLFKQWGEWAPPVSEDPDVPMGALAGRVYKVGKKAAGRTLDGQLHDGYPA